MFLYISPSSALCWYLPGSTFACTFHLLCVKIHRSPFVGSPLTLSFWLIMDTVWKPDARSVTLTHFMNVGPGDQAQDQHAKSQPFRVAIGHLKSQSSLTRVAPGIDGPIDLRRVHLPVI